MERTRIRYDTYSPIWQMWMEMWMSSDRLPYRKRHGELRSLPSHPYPHLKRVNATGFFCLKDQLELLLHILRNSTVLKTMRIEPKQTVVAGFCPLISVDPLASADGYKVAKKCIFCKEDHRGVVQIAGVRFANAPLYHWSTTASCRNHAWKLNTQGLVILMELTRSMPRFCDLIYAMKYSNFIPLMHHFFVFLDKISGQTWRKETKIKVHEHCNFCFWHSSLSKSAEHHHQQNKIKQIKK